MDTPSFQSTPELARFIRPFAFGTAFVIALGFHFLVSYVPSGWPLALFALLVASAIMFITQKVQGLRNQWALLFLIPLICGSLSSLLYESEVTRTLSFLTIAGSLMALAYWLTAPAVEWRKGIHLWKTNVFIETALPFRQYQALFTEPSGARKLNAKLLLQIALGLLVAGPVLLIFLSLFLEGDRFFSQVMGQWFTFDFMTDNVVRLFFDVLVFFFASAFFWGIARRSREEASVKEPKTPFQELVALRSFLFAIGALFVVFAGFQVFYLFQGSGYILAQGRTYAEYAVSGYQQLCAAAAFALGILIIVYRLSNMEDRWVRISSVIIGITSLISTFSAGKRLWLYVDAYGLTLSRSWGMEFLALIMVLFGVLLWSLKRRWNIHQLISASSLVSLGLLSLALVYNQEGLVARYNLARHAEQKGPALDLSYLATQLSSDAIPAIVSAFQEPTWSDNHVNMSNYSLSDGQPPNVGPRERVYGYWKNEVLPQLKRRPSRELTASSLRAERAIEMPR
ncbi:DUF4173 domain-containing protein [Patescibacteria group bacterium]|nr:DUF4173 domain-containing protein [Patescibacteria group bacterium]